MKKVTIGIALLIVLLFAVGVIILRINAQKQTVAKSVSIIGQADGPTSIFIAAKVGDDMNNTGYTSITMKEAQSIFETSGEYIILDVRRADEYATGHIPSAINVSNEDILSASIEDNLTNLPDKQATIYVYCRSGNRSKQSAIKLVAMGYTNIIEIGGILDWEGSVER